MCLHVSDGGSVWNKVERLLNGKYNTNTNTNGKYKCDKLSCQASWRNGADPVWRVVQADWRFDQQFFFLEIFFLLFKGLTNKCVGILQRARKHRSIIFIFELLRSWNIQTGPLCRGHTVAGRRRQEVGHLDKEEPRSSGVTQTWWLKGNIGSISLIDINVF